MEEAFVLCTELQAIAVGLNVVWAGFIVSLSSATSVWFWCEGGRRGGDGPLHGLEFHVNPKRPVTLNLEQTCIPIQTLLCCPLTALYMSLCFGRLRVAIVSFLGNFTNQSPAPSPLHTRAAMDEKTDFLSTKSALIQTASRMTSRRTRESAVVKCTRSSRIAHVVTVIHSSVAQEVD